MILINVGNKAQNNAQNIVVRAITIYNSNNVLLNTNKENKN